MSSTASARIYADRDRMLPRALIRAMLALVAASLAIAAFARLTDRPLESVPPEAPVIAEAHLLMQSDGMSGAVYVTDLEGNQIADLSPEEGGFIAGVHRVILRERNKHRVAADQPIILQAQDNGRMFVVDPATGWKADLMGFGSGNAAAFARLLVQSGHGEMDGNAGTQN